MSKAVLVIDTPNNCSECPCCDGIECGNKYKGYVDGHLEWNSGRPSWCPLRPLPIKYGADIDEPYALGYNACIDAITGETE